MQQPNWAEVVTAVGTAVLAFGVLIAIVQLGLTLRQTRLIETQHLVDLINNSKIVALNKRIEKFDRYDSYLDTSRSHALALYVRIQRLGRFMRFRKLLREVDSALGDAADITDRVEIYIRSGNAEEGMVAEYAGYLILATFYILQDVFRKEALESDYSYEGFYDLACRIQDYAKLKPLGPALRAELVWTTLRPITYADGSQSMDYLSSWSLLRRARLAIATLTNKPRS